MRQVMAGLVVAVAAVACGRAWGQVDAGGGGAIAALPAGVKVTRGIVYAKNADGADLRLDTYVPTAGDGRAMPVLLRLGTKREAPTAAAMELLGKGYGLVYAAYLPEATPANVAFTRFPNDLHAAKAAVRWIRGAAVQNGFDKERIGLWASGSGASIAALLAMTPDQPALNGTMGDYPKESNAIRALCLFGGTTDWRNAELYGDETVNIPGSPAYQLFGDNPKGAPDAARQASAVNYIRPTSPAVLMVTLASDPNRAMHLIFAETLRRAGVASALYEEETGAGLGGKSVDEGKLNQRVLQFFDDTLAGGNAPPRMTVQEEITRLADAGLYKQANRLIEEQMARVTVSGRAPWLKLTSELASRQREPAIARLKEVLKAHAAAENANVVWTIREVLTDPERIGQYDVEATLRAQQYDARARALQAVQALNALVVKKDWTAAERQADRMRLATAQDMDGSLVREYLARYAALRAQPMAWPQGVSPVAYAADFGQDLYGNWMDVKAGGVMQRFRWIPPGNFAMGSPKDEWGRLPNEPILQPTTIARGFWLADCEVTQAMWNGVMGKGDNPSHFTGANLPVDGVSYAHAVNFLRAMGLGARLPTEAEWEYACRAGGRDMYPGTGRLKDTAWFWDEAQDTRDSSDIRILHDLETVSGGATGTHAVKGKLPNPWGLYDMQGNVWEWCEPIAGAGAAQRSELARETKVLKGGSWLSIPQSCRPARSAAFGIEQGSWTFGMRVVIPGS
ncbi:MAG TPA: SUMF1/EgtB/PvdO family nonheme iron enzyme [Phycisphaerae bacterium]|nr:SUMF1/EgtB/PvdO family nonheme iron enzyme [Phycisphaerae bacterium]